MPLRIEDYAMLSDTQTCALVGKDGSVDWLGFPRMDSPACFAALLGDAQNGRWLLSPAGEVTRVKRRYRPGTLILETEMTTAEGTVRLIDFMPPRESKPDLVRIVEGVSGRVAMRMEYVVRFDYGSVVPWVRRLDHTLEAVAGPDALTLHTFDVDLRGEDMKTTADFVLEAKQRAQFVLTWHPSHLKAGKPVDPQTSLAETEKWWTRWSQRCTYQGEWKEAVLGSLVALKGLTYGPTGGIAAAATTSLPEFPGGVRNWDYRYCWLRDATFTLIALWHNGFHEEARRWRDWLVRAVAGDASQLQIMYGVSGERRLDEREIAWLAGYEGSKPVRVGNAAVEQFQLDVYGEVMDALFHARMGGSEGEQYAWSLQKNMLEFLEGNWEKPDEGIWEVRGPRRHFTHSKMMAWVALDRAVRTVEKFQVDGPVEHWRKLRSQVHAEVLEKGFDAQRGCFTQYYGSDHLDASVLMMPHVGFLPATDPRVRGTVAAVEKELMRDGFVLRYSEDAQGHVDGLPPGEGAFLACSFWLADCYALMGERKKAVDLFERLLALRNDVGLLAEEYDPRLKRQLGNFPQAFSHVTLVNTALTLGRDGIAAARLSLPGRSEAESA